MMRAAHRLVAFLLISVVVKFSSAFVGRNSPQPLISSRLFIIPSLQKFTDKGEYNKVVEGLMLTQGITREQAEKEYDGV